MAKVNTTKAKMTKAKMTKAKMAKAKKAKALRRAHLRAAAADRNLDLLLAQAGAKLTSVVPAADILRRSLYAQLIEIRIDRIDGCVYNDDLGGWIQPAGAPSPTVHFTVTNKGYGTYFGEVTANVDGIPLIRYGNNEATQLSLTPRGSLSGRLWFYAFPGSVEPKVLQISFCQYSTATGVMSINPKTGQPGKGGVGSRPVATNEYPFIACGNRAESNAAMIKALNISSVVDSGGRLVSASAVDRHGLLRQLHFSAYEQVAHTTPGVSRPYDTKIRFYSSITYSEEVLGQSTAYDTSAHHGVGDEAIPGRMLTIGTQVVFDDAGADLFSYRLAVLGFPNGSAVNAPGKTANSSTWIVETTVPGSIGPRGETVVESKLTLKGTVLGAPLNATYYINNAQPTAGTYVGPNISLDRQFPNEISRMAYFSPLLNEDLILASVGGPFFHATPSTAALTSVPTSPSMKGAALKNVVPMAKLHKGKKGKKGWSLQTVVLDPTKLDGWSAIWPNRNEWTGIGIVAVTAMLTRLACAGTSFGGPWAWGACGAGTLLAAFNTYLAKRVAALPVNTPANLPNPNKVAPQPRPTGGTSPNTGSGPYEPPLINPGMPGGIGSEQCQIGWVNIDGHCVPLTPGGTWPFDR